VKLKLKTKPIHFNQVMCAVLKHRDYWRILGFKDPLVGAAILLGLQDVTFASFQQGWDIANIA
jgi:hypothetical protein